MKIVTIVGARPQFIKCALLSRQLREAAVEVLIHTGQHYDDNMSEVFFHDLEIPQPEYNLGVGSGTHGQQSSEMLRKIEEILQQENPEYVLVFGDTNSTLAGALAAAKLCIPVVHVEAGLRSFNRQMPEEINRVLTDHLACRLFCPTETSVKNLMREGITEGVHLVGDIMYDAALHYGSKAEKQSRILKTLGIRPNEYILGTIHRAENTDQPQRIRAIFEGLAMMAKRLPVLIPLHPRTQLALKRNGLFNRLSKSIQVIDPVGYLDMVMLEKHARLIATDSGGVQKEAFFHRVPCVTLRDETEWVELVQLGWNRVMPPLSAIKVFEALDKMLEQRGSFAYPYGTGDTAQKIVDALLTILPPRWSCR